MTQQDSLQSLQAYTAGEFFPRGWYALAFSHEVQPEDVKTIGFLGREYVLWRTESGIVSLMEPHCPHLGAHLGHGGEVFGDTLRCPMHHFRFNADGSCAASGYGCQSPPKTRARTLGVEEHSGFIFARHEPDAADSAWMLPSLSWSQSRPMLRSQVRVPSRVRDVACNAARIGSMAPHGYSGTLQLSPPERDRHQFHTRTLLIDGSETGSDVEISVTLHGLGAGVIDAAFDSGRIFTRTVFALTPVSIGETDIRMSGWIDEVSLPAEQSQVIELAPRLIQRWFADRLSGTTCEPEDAVFAPWAAQFTPASPSTQDLFHVLEAISAP